MTDPVVHLYALVWNERPLLPFFLEHYRPFVDKFFLFDDGSDDGSYEYLAEQADVVLEKFDSTGASFVETARQFYCDAWKASRGKAHYVIVVNIDELVHHPSPSAALRMALQENVTVIGTRGWEMVGDALPESGPLSKAIAEGVHSISESKIAIFDPNAITEINYGPGRHHANPQGRVRSYRRPRFDLLHYKFVSADYLVRRYRELGARMRAGDSEARYGVRYHHSETELRATHQRLRAAAVPVLTEGLKAAGLLDEPLPGVFVSKLRQVNNDKGSLREIWRQDDPFGTDVHQTYLTTTAPGVVKAWYLHQRQTDQITPAFGSGRLVLWDRRTPANPTPPVVIELDADDPVFIVIPPGIWHGFQAYEAEPLVLLHMNGAVFDHVRTDELRRPHDDPEIPYRWPTIA